MEKIIKNIKQLISLKGLIAISIGILLLSGQLLNWSSAIATIFILDALMSIRYSIVHARIKNSMALKYFAVGIVSCSLGILILYRSPVEYITLITLINIWLTISGLSQLALSQFLKKRNYLWVPVLINGIFSISLGIIVILSLNGVTNLGIYLTSIAFLIFGSLLEYIAFKLQYRILG